MSERRKRIAEITTVLALAVGASALFGQHGSPDHKKANATATLPPLPGMVNGKFPKPHTSKGHAWELPKHIAPHRYSISREEYAGMKVNKDYLDLPEKSSQLMDVNLAGDERHQQNEAKQLRKENICGPNVKTTAPEQPVYTYTDGHVPVELDGSYFAGQDHLGIDSYGASDHPLKEDYYAYFDGDLRKLHVVSGASLLKKYGQVELQLPSDVKPEPAVDYC